MNKQMKPCPFCGAIPAIMRWGGLPTKQLIRCDNDDCAVAPEVKGSTQLKAIEKWNRRYP